MMPEEQDLRRKVTCEEMFKKHIRKRDGGHGTDFRSYTDNEI